MQTNKENLIIQKTFEFSIEIMIYVDLLMEKRKYHWQINYSEAGHLLVQM